MKDGLKYDTGEYNRQLHIEALPADRNEIARLDEYRQPIEDFKAVAWRWARIAPLDSRETWRAQQATALATHQINFRCFPGLTSRHRLRMGKRVFNIEGFTDLGDRHYEQEVRAVEVEEKPG